MSRTCCGQVSGQVWQGYDSGGANERRGMTSHGLAAVKEEKILVGYVIMFKLSYIAVYDDTPEFCSCFFLALFSFSMASALCFVIPHSRALTWLGNT